MLWRAGRWCVALSVWVLCTIGPVGPRALAATRFGDITVSAPSPPGGDFLHGYTEYRFSVTNHAPDRSHKVSLFLPRTSYRSGDCLRRVSRSVTVGPSSTVRVSLLQPPLPLYGQGFGVVIDGQTQRESPHLSVGYGRTPWGHSTASFVQISRGASGDFNAAADRARRSFHHELLHTESPVTEWSTNWLGYSSYDGFVITGEELRQMSPATRLALWRYTECGGVLVVLGLAEVPEAWRSSQKMGTDLTMYSVGFGQCFISGATDPNHWSDEQWQDIANAWRATYEPFEDMRGVDEANDEFPVIEGLTTPVRGLLVLMLVFVVTIGPVNLWLLARKKKKIWLLWTVPAVSLLTCGAVTLYAAIAEGWHGRLRIETVTILDQTAHRATTIGWAAFYAPVTPGGGLHFGYETELTPQVSKGWYYGRGSGRPRDVDWTHDQHLTTGWVRARVPAHFMVRKSEPRRERLAIKQAQDGSLTVVNGLGVPIRELWVADENGKIHRATNIPAGAQVVLTPGDTLAGPHKSVGDLRDLYRRDWLDGMDKMRATPTAFLMPCTYIATLDDAPFIEQGLDKAKVKECRSLVYGLVGAIAGED